MLVDSDEPALAQPGDIDRSALACCADETRDLLMRQAKVDQFALRVGDHSVFLGQPEDERRHAPRHIEEDEILQLLLELADALAHLDGDLHPKRGAALDVAFEILTPDDAGGHFGHGLREGLTRHVVEQRMLTEDLARFEHRERHLLAACREAGELHAALFEEIDLVASVTGEKDHLALIKSAMDRVRLEFAEIVLFHSLEDVDVFQIPDFVG